MNRIVTSHTEHAGEIAPALKSHLGIEEQKDVRQRQCDPHYHYRLRNGKQYWPDETQAEHSGDQTENQEEPWR